VPDNRPSIDWEAVRQRLRQSELALEKGLAGDPRHVEEIYRKRAARLARPEAPEAGPASVSVVLVFTVGSERYAVELPQVREVVEAPRIIPIPGSPQELAGVINVRGHIEPVWETALLLGLTPPASLSAGYAVLLRRGELPGALRVDRLLHVRPLRSDEWQRPTAPSSHAKGVTADRITLIDAAALLQQGGLG
jgi:purine-binding chemotaxis protein CheW